MGAKKLAAVHLCRFYDEAEDRRGRRGWAGPRPSNTACLVERVVEFFAPEEFDQMLNQTHQRSMPT
eukprot:10966194-Alexandrium_andersonii.AAC.1